MKSIHENEYQKALDYLYSHIDYSLTRNLRYSPEKFNLDRMYKFLEKLGNPHLDYSTIHIAGTKGKGSVCAMIASVLKTAGYRTGFYSSPHMQEFTERIRINGSVISKKEFAIIVNEIKPVAETIEDLTTFEITTAASFHYFSKKNVEVAIIEVGLGGRLDATNVVNPIVSVITPISLDHVKILGDTIEKIAVEKAGIIKSNRPVVVAPQTVCVNKIIEKIANERFAPVTRIKQDIIYQQLSHSYDYQTFLLWHSMNSEGAYSGYKDNKKECIELSIPLLGEHQMQNAATAFRTLEILKENGFRITDEELKKGFKEVVWPGRFEILNKHPFLIIDSAHNVDSTRKLIKAIDDYFPGFQVILIFGASEDKDIDGMLKLLSKRAEKIILTKAFHPRAIEPVEICKVLEKYTNDIVTTCNCEEALESAKLLMANNKLILASGSIFIAAAIRNLWNGNKKL